MRWRNLASTFSVRSAGVVQRSWKSAANMRRSTMSKSAWQKYGRSDKSLETDRCEMCGRERPKQAISELDMVKYCNDNHDGRECHINVVDARKRMLSPHRRTA